MCVNILQFLVTSLIAQTSFSAILISGFSFILLLLHLPLLPQILCLLLIGSFLSKLKLTYQYVDCGCGP
jgi:hypothetical protein